MYAIVDIAGQQFKVEENKSYFVHRLEGEEGSAVEFNKVMLVEADGNISVGKPVIDGAKITGKIMTHLKGDKVIIFKKKRRKGYQKMNGHRQYFSKILVENITF
ncbi:MAG: 50S ribosomal protein L21 [Bacteroidales bacterium]|jgi:large subunit ribosomal protein L21|nr:50S ribosomal protein L21 [Bacteroidales bacterium]